MTVSIRLDESVSSERSVAGGAFNASLADPLIVDGLVIAERGARVGGRIVDVQKAARLDGTSLIELELTSISTADGQKIGVSTDPWMKRGDGLPRTNAGFGAIIGAIARGRPADVPSATIVRFRLATRVTITERQL
jgi:hypothetical protein